MQMPMWPINTYSAAAAAAVAANNVGTATADSYNSPNGISAAAAQFFAVNSGASCAASAAAMDNALMKFDENTDLKSVQQHHLANFVQTMSNFQHFQRSNSPTNTIHCNNTTTFGTLHSANSYFNNSSSSNGSLAGPIKKKSKPVPNEQKTQAYFERRKKNNDSARRSRDQRRRKEEETQKRNTFLEQENIRLKAENNRLTMEVFQLSNAYNFVLQQQPVAQQQTQQQSYVV